VTNACGGCGALPAEVCNGLDDNCDGAVDEGCMGCSPDEHRSCYGGPEGTEDVGPCRAGVQYCLGGAWGLCEDQVLPGEELCNNADDDCDDETDEGLLNACGGCGEAPQEVCNGLDDDCDGDTDEGVATDCGGCAPCGQALIFPAESGEGDSSLAPAPDGAVTLGSGRVDSHFIWVPNSNEGSVSRWDTRSGKEVSRYWIGANPSRTSVDLDGNAWIAHRGDGKASHVFTNTADCIDRNGNGVIDTSRDLNQDGRITGAEMVGSAEEDPLLDECVHCQINIGTSTDWIRGVGVDADNYAWFGSWYSRELFKVDPQTCEVLLTLPNRPSGSTTARPIYGLAIDENGMLWTSTYTDDCITKTDTATGVVLEEICDDPTTRYGIAVGGDGRIWFGDTSNAVLSYRPETGVWTRYADDTGTLNYTAGVVVDLTGHVWVASFNSHIIGKLNPEMNEWQFFSVLTPPSGFLAQRTPRGVTIDSDGNIWGICRDSSGLVKLAPDGQMLGSYRVVNNLNPAQGTGPYSYSDNTGFQLMNYTVRDGAWRHLFDAGAQVSLIRLEYSPYTPPGTSISVRLRAAADEATLEAAPWTDYIDGTPVELATLFPAQARYLQMEFLLATEDPAIRPVLRDIRVYFQTSDCRDAATPCPEGQVCDERNGGCIVLPVQCSQDGACGAAEYCDAGGVCRQGCRLEPGFCEQGWRCDPDLRICQERVGECASDVQCPSGTWCAADGVCDPGCRVSPDSCPPRNRCDAISRVCLPLPPECTQDANCPGAEYCNADGVCLLGCRLSPDTCAPSQVCDAVRRECVPPPEACDPGNTGPEVCNGLDDDCDGNIDQDTTDTGLTCLAGDEAPGNTVCYGGRVLCRVHPSTDPVTPVVLSGDVVDAILPEGIYAAPTDFNFGGMLIVEAGAIIAAPDTLQVSMYQIDGAHLEVSGARLEGLSIRCHWNGTLRVVDSEIIGRAGLDNRLEALWRATDLHLINTWVVDTELVAHQNATVTLEYTRLEQTDDYNRWLATIASPLVVTDSEFLGRNIVPRVGSGGLQVTGAQTLDLRDTVFNRLNTALDLTSTGALDVRQNVFIDSDVAVRVSGRTFPLLEDNSIDSRDVGLPSVGIKFDALRMGGGATIRRTEFLLAEGDRAYWLDPDVFQIASPTIIEDSTILGVEPSGQYLLSGTGDAGEILLAMPDLATELSVAGAINFSGGLIDIPDGMVLKNAYPQYTMNVSTAWGGQLTVGAASLEDLSLRLSLGSTATFSGSTLTAGPNLSRLLMYNNAATLNLVGASLRSTDPISGTTRRSRGVETVGVGVTTVSDSTFEDLEYGLITRTGATLALSGSTLRSCANAVWAENLATLDPITANTIEDDDPELASVGYNLRFDTGGRAAIDGTTFAIGAEDIPYLIDPDFFQQASPSTVSNTTWTGGEQGQGVVLRGDSNGGVMTIGPVEGQDTLTLQGNVRILSGTQATIADGMTITGAATTNQYLVVSGTDSSLSAAAGVTFRDMTLQVLDVAQASLSGVVFDATSNRNRDYLYISGTALVDGCTFAGFGRTQQGVVVDWSGDLTMTGCGLSDLEYGMLAYRDTLSDVSGTSFVDSTWAVRAQANATVTLGSCSFINQDATHVMNGVDVRSTTGGLSMTVIDPAFDLGAEDGPYAFSQDAFNTNQTLALSGSTYLGGELGMGYRLWGNTNSLPIAFVMMEPAQDAFRITGNMQVQGAGTLSIADACVFQSSSATAARIFYVTGSATAIVGSASFERVQLRFQDTTAGSVTGAAFTTDLSWIQIMLSIGATGAILVDGCQFYRTGSLTNYLRGIQIWGAAEVVPTVQNCTFDDLNYGIYVEQAPVPILLNNVFNTCVNDVYQVP